MNRLEGININELKDLADKGLILNSLLLIENKDPKFQYDLTALDKLEV